MASGLAGGACLLGVAIFGIFLLDMNLGRKKGWRRSITVSATFVACCISVMAAPLGVLLVNVKHLPNEQFLDPYHALVASAVGSSLIFSIRIVFKVVSVARRRHLRRRQQQKEAAGIGMQPYAFAYDPALAYNDHDDEFDAIVTNAATFSAEVRLFERLETLKDHETQPAFFYTPSESGWQFADIFLM
ncbi:hypothetical protein BDN72DRAFT_901422 [Pluteus cervinus]|uniref:Uncharacterized protein n=1 Tax=Pluteus cervinus TaxID=181527 RepID=A0ACD3AGM4_9AGAR|nr:hypothetical protein BDN72DRAFT_901422 [Pluteus cervinus]